MPVDLVVGDLDSVDPAALDAAVADGAVVERHPAAKDATDLELALDAAVDRGATAVLVVGVGGGRLDHFLGNVLLLASPRYAHVRVDARIGDAFVTVVRDRVELDGRPGRALLAPPARRPRESACSPTACGSRCAARRSPPGTTRGVSNEFLGTRATVSLDDGVLLAVIPDHRKARP